MIKPQSFYALFVVLFVLYSCQSVDKYNAHLQQKITVDQLKKDVDFIQKKLYKNHPKLDLYLSKNQIEAKFDSFKNTINQPLLPNEFFVNLYPIIASLKHGHTDIYPYHWKESKKDLKRLKDSKGPFGQLGFSWFNDSVYLVHSSVKDSTIRPGSILLKIDSISPYDLKRKYKNVYHGDGNNLTYAENRYSRDFIDSYYTLENGLKDSINFVFKHDGKIYSKMVKRIFPEKPKELKPQKELPKTNNKINKSTKFTIKPYKYSYNKKIKNYGKILSFPTNDSAFAVLKVYNFRYGKYQENYKDIFEKIKAYKVKNLVLDLRNNGGGRLADSHQLYSYLVGEKKSYLGDQIVNSKSAFHNTIVDMVPWYAKPIVYPISLFSYFITKKNDKGEVLIKPSLARIKYPNEDLVYNGNLYVLINGGSYSASAVISSNLKGINRACFIGEETGGDATGTVAGFMPIYSLPNSKLKFTMGTILLQPKYASNFEKGRGLKPDYFVKPSLKDKLNYLDPELIWVLNDVKNNNVELLKVINSKKSVTNFK